MVVPYLSATRYVGWVGLDASTTWITFQSGWGEPGWNGHGFFDKKLTPPAMDEVMGPQEMAYKWPYK